MNFEYSSYILPLLAAVIISAVVSLYAWMRRSARGALALSLLASAILAGTIGYAVEIADVDRETKYLGGVIEYYGSAFAPYQMNGFGTAPDFTRDEWWLTVNTGQIWCGEFHNHRKDGYRFWESAIIAPVTNADELQDKADIVLLKPVNISQLRDMAERMK